MLMVATIWYIVITTALNIVQYYVERRVARGAVRTLPSTPWQRVRARLASERADARERKRTRLHTEGSSL